MQSRCVGNRSSHCLQNSSYRRVSRQVAPRHRSASLRMTHLLKLHYHIHFCNVLKTYSDFNVLLHCTRRLRRCQANMNNDIKPCLPRRSSTCFSPYQANLAVISHKLGHSQMYHAVNRRVLVDKRLLRLSRSGDRSSASNSY